MESFFQEKGKWWVLQEICSAAKCWRFAGCGLVRCQISLQSTEYSVASSKSLSLVAQIATAAVQYEHCLEQRGVSNPRLCMLWELGCCNISPLHQCRLIAPSKVLQCSQDSLFICCCRVPYSGCSAGNVTPFDHTQYLFTFFGGTEPLFFALGMCWHI